MSCSNDTKSVKELGGYRFLIPSYQRGYRWDSGKEGDQVDRLLDDITSYLGHNGFSTQTYYCLQPLVVRKNSGDDSWEVIDGQQRLTTIFLILKYLEKHFPYENLPLFEIEYTTRAECKAFLNGIDELCDDPSANGNIDFNCIAKAYRTIRGFFDGKEENAKRFCELFTSSLRGDVRFIWYNVTSECDQQPGYEKSLFSRLNEGKIPLTKSELVKALLLNNIEGQLRLQIETDARPTSAPGLDADDVSQRVLVDVADCLDSMSGSIRLLIAAKMGQLPSAVGSREMGQLAQLLRQRIAEQWDRMELRLSDQEFWSFLYGQREDGKYPARMDFMLSLLVPEKEDVFVYYERRISSQDVTGVHTPEDIAVLKAWKEVTSLFQRLDDWFKDREIFHLAGFLRHMGVSIRQLMDFYEKEATGISDFKKRLRLNAIYMAIPGNGQSALKTSFDDEDPRDSSWLDDVVYNDGKSDVKNILLLLNILSILHNKESSQRFSFHHFLSEDYDIEHIKPQTPKDFKTRKQKEEFCKQVIDCLFSGYDDTKRGEIIKKITSVQRIHRKSIGIPDWGFADTGSIINMVKKIAAFLDDESMPDPGFENEELAMLGADSQGGGDGLGNLVLLDSSTNRKYGNAIFLVKRKTVMDREHEGRYILPCTRDVFGKMYTTTFSNPFKWTQADGECYLKSMKKLIEEA